MSSTTRSYIYVVLLCTRKTRDTDSFFYIQCTMHPHPPPYCMDFGDTRDYLQTQNAGTLFFDYQRIICWFYHNATTLLLLFFLFYMGLLFPTTRARWKPIPAAYPLILVGDASLPVIPSTDRMQQFTYMTLMLICWCWKSCYVHLPGPLSTIGERLPTFYFSG